ncbi:MAG: tetratricopeptide repeat protein, partial [Elusimicrobiaceae bacterium]|nr:tetratricopeptide repeat protein [Elusimicrobiaceae bacterium]
KDAFRYYARALAYMDDEKYTLAAADLTKAIALKKDYLDFYLYRAQAQMALEKYDSAIADYQKYLTKKAETPQIALALAEAYIKTYKYPQAEEELDFVEEQDGQRPEIYFWRGRIEQNQGHLDEAVSFYSKAINRDGAFAPAYRYRASAFKDMGELEASAQDYTQLVALQPEPIFYNRRGLVYEELAKWDEALADYNKTIELSPQWPIAYNNRGYVYLKQGKYAQAKADFETALKLDDSLPTPYINLAGLAWLQKKDRRQVFRYLDKALKRNFKDFESLYDDDRKGWMFEGINNTSEFRAVMYK